MNNLKLDIFPHIFPLAYFERMKRVAENNPALAAQLKRWMHIPVLWDLERRIKMMKRWPGYKQILTLSMPAVEFLGTPEETPELARLANDGMHEIVQKHKDLFPAFVASLPMNHPQAALAEMDRAINQLGARGIQIITSVAGRRAIIDANTSKEFHRRTHLWTDRARQHSACATRGR
jgi:predicted TIM-barrel fold metal-dependent hydrolase